MLEINNLDDLETAIKQLEAQRDQDWLALKVQFSETMEDLRPANLLKNAVQEMITSPELKHNLIDTALGMTTGFLAKKLVFGQTHNPISRLLGVVLETAVSNKVAKHPDGIKSVGKSVGKFLINKFFSGGNHNHNGHADREDDHRDQD